MPDIAVKVESLSKLYKIGARQKGYKTLRESVMGILTAPFRRLAHRAKRKANPAKRSALSALRSSSDAMLRAPCSMQSSQSDDHIWALKDVSFEVKQGEVVGIIGRNGAGKTTLLKILSRITEPTDGRAEIHGRVGSLLEVGTGFHPELTGRENIYLNGAILGMRKAEMEHKFDEIVSFSEIEKFIDTPVKRYSSGMYVRLAFAVAAHMEPEVLVVDEVLAVGDAAFQKKCLGKMGDVAKEGRTVLFVSHNMAAIENLCGRCVLFDKGKLECMGQAPTVIEHYIDGISERAAAVQLDVRTDREGNGEIRILGFHLERRNGQMIRQVVSGQDCYFVLDYKCADDKLRNNVTVSFAVKNRHGASLFHHRTNFTNQDFSMVPPRGQFLCRIPKLPLAAGQYSVAVFVAVGGDVADFVDHAAVFYVEAGNFFGSGHPGMPSHSQILVEGNWELRREPKA